MTKTHATLGITILLAGLLGLLAGCNKSMTLQGGQRGNPFTPKSRGEPARADYVQGETVVDGAGDLARGATDVAMEWADKYAKVAQELLFANKRIADLEREKKKSQTQVAAIQAELAGYQRELNDANAMLSDMKHDLKEWRGNVLGIRKDFMASQNAILSSQQKILELLGGEVSRVRFQRASQPVPVPAREPQATKAEPNKNLASN